MINIDRNGLGNINVDGVDIKYVNRITLNSSAGERPELEINIISSAQIIELMDAKIKINNVNALSELKNFILNLYENKKIDSDEYIKIIDLIKII